MIGRREFITLIGGAAAVGCPLKAAAQQPSKLPIIGYFGASAAWRTPGVPTWVDYDAAAYGVGDVDGRGVKVCSDREGPPGFDADGDRVPLAEHERRAREILARPFPALAAAPLVGTRVCQYELTADTRFLVAPHPEHDGRVWLLGGGSGHGFKHGPALAERVEGWIAGNV